MSSYFKAGRGRVGVLERIEQVMIQDHKPGGYNRYTTAASPGLARRVRPLRLSVEQPYKTLMRGNNKEHLI